MKPVSASNELEIAPEIRKTAARWRVRRDEGLAPGEEREFFRWLDADERHAIACGDLEATVEMLATLPTAEVVPIGSSGTQALPRKRSVFWPAMLAAAAAIAVGLFVIQRRTIDYSVAPTVASRFLDLPDGSVIELNAGSRVTFSYSDTERRVRLVSGEAHFTVAKHQPRPFIVEAGGLAICAVGTAFNVRLDPRDVQVLVTEGRVQLRAPDSDAAPAAGLVLPADPFVDAGHRVTIPFADLRNPAEPAAEVLPAATIDAALAWRARPLVFNDVPLAEVVAAFNEHNRHQLVIDDPELARRRFGGTFRPDAYDAVVRLLEADFGVTAEQLPDRTVLRRTR